MVCVKHFYLCNQYHLKSVDWFIICKSLSYYSTVNSTPKILAFATLTEFQSCGFIFSRVWYKKEIKQHVFLTVWLLSFGVVTLRSIHCVCIISFFLFITQAYCSARVHHSRVASLASSFCWLWLKRLQIFVLRNLCKHE